MKRILFGALAMSILPALGCAHNPVERHLARRDEIKAEKAADKGHYRKAERYEDRAIEHESREGVPLP